MLNKFSCYTNVQRSVSKMAKVSRSISCDSERTGILRKCLQWSGLLSYVPVSFRDEISSHVRTWCTKCETWLRASVQVQYYAERNKRKDRKSVVECSRKRLSISRKIALCFSTVCECTCVWPTAQLTGLEAARPGSQAFNFQVLIF